jgi:hypothetical protein
VVFHETVNGVSTLPLGAAVTSTTCRSGFSTIGPMMSIARAL